MIFHGFPCKTVMFLLSGLLLERRGHAFSLVFLVILTCPLRPVKLVTLVDLSWGFFFSGFPCSSDMFLASGEIGDTGKPEQGLLFHRFSL